MQPQGAGFKAQGHGSGLLRKMLRRPGIQVPERSKICSPFLRTRPRKAGPRFIAKIETADFALKVRYIFSLQIEPVIQNPLSVALRYLDSGPKCRALSYALKGRHIISPVRSAGLKIIGQSSPRGGEDCRSYMSIRGQRDGSFICFSPVMASNRIRRCHVVAWHDVDLQFEPVIQEPADRPGISRLRPKNRSSLDMTGRGSSKGRHISLKLSSCFTVMPLQQHAAHIWA